MKDESLYPPRCCRQAMNWDDVNDELPADLVAEFEAKKEELDRKGGERIDCHVPTCSAFVGPGGGEARSVVCPKYSTSTCTKCKAAAHDNDCAQDQALQDVFNAAAASGWQTCGQCKRIIELNYGCNHMM